MATEPIPDNEPASLFDPWIIWVTFRRYWPIALPIGVNLAGAVACAVLQSFVPMYRATHLLEANHDFVVFKHVMPALKNLERTEKPLFFNAIVLDPVLADQSLQAAPSLSDPESAEANLRKNLRVTSGGTESRLQVSYEDSDPESAAQVCNAIVESYLRQRDAYDNKRVSNLERWLEPEIRRWEQNVQAKQRVVQRLSQQTLGYAPGQQASKMEIKSNLDLATSLRSQITELSLKISIGEARLAMEQAAGAQVNQENELNEPGGTAVGEAEFPHYEPTELEISRLASADVNVNNARSQIAQYRSAILELEDKVRPGIRHPMYEKYKERVTHFTSVLAQAEAQARADAIAKLKQVAERRYRQELAEEVEQAQINQRNNQLANHQQLAAAKTEIEDHKRELSILTQQYERERVLLEQFGGASAELQFAQEELGVANDVLHKLRDRVAAIRTERQQDGAVRSLAPSTPPRNAVESVPTKKLAMYGGAALLFPFMIGLLWEIRVQRLTDSAMCVKNGMSVIGEIARFPTGKQLEKQHRLFQESVDTLRTNLSLSVTTAQARTFAIVSSMAGEGKSKVASQLALSIAKATGEIVLLVDADLRCPEQHEIFGLKMGAGLSGVLANDVKLSEAVDKSLGDSIHVLPSGPSDGNHHQIINTENVKAFVDSASKEYAYIIFDTAPILSAGESLAFASNVDAALLCVMRDVSRADNVARATLRLEAVGAKLAGSVFNGIPAWQYVDRFGDYHATKSESRLEKAA